MSQDDLDHIPAIVPTRDGEPRRSSKIKAGSGERSRITGNGKRPAPAAGSGVLARFVMTLALVVAMVACAWAWQLQSQLQQTSDQVESYASRIGDLEARLSDTDEGMNQSAAVQAVKIGELESEVRKLWDNVWKQSKERLDKLESASSRQGKSLNSIEGSVADTQSELKDVSGDIAKLKGVAGDLSRLMVSAKANQAEVERVADALNAINLQLAKLDKRVQGSEEWVGSVNAFRRQVNTSLSELQATVRSMQSTTP